MHPPHGFESAFDVTREPAAVEQRRGQPVGPQLLADCPQAEWIEREIWEMLGINFKGHPNLKRLLLAEDWPEDKYPLRNKQ